MLRIIGTVLLFVLIVLLVLTLGGAALLLLAYGLGLLVSWVTHFEPFQATILALAAIMVAGILAERILLSPADCGWARNLILNCLGGGQVA